jgi:pyridoxamine 5'-phosphate oxidase
MTTNDSSPGPAPLPPIAALRIDYHRGQLLESDADPDPLRQFASWFAEAGRSGVEEPNAMTVSTVNPEGGVSSRILLLKGLDDTGFQFFTNRSSRKGAQLAADSRSSLGFFWPSLQRQVNVEGVTELLPDSESDAYFASRPYASRIGAWVSEQSAVIPGRDWLDRREAEFRARFPENAPVPRPPHWGGYRLVPLRIEFWQGRPSRLHDRLLYARDSPAAPWQRSRLSP